MTTTSILTRPPKTKFESYLQRVAQTDPVKAAMSKHITPERITALLLAEAGNPKSKLPEIVKTPQGEASIARFFMIASQTGLEPGATLGLLYPTPRRIAGKWEILPIIGYKGLCELARRSGQVARINASAFYADEVEKGLIRVTREPPDVLHEWAPDVDMTDDENVVGAYAVVETKDGARFVEVLNRTQIERTRMRSPTGGADFSPWKSDYAAMARKTALRRLLMGGTVPIATEVVEAIKVHDGDAEDYGASFTEVFDPETGEVLEEQEAEAPKSGDQATQEALGLDGGTLPDGAC